MKTALIFIVIYLLSLPVLVKGSTFLLRKIMSRFISPAQQKQNMRNSEPKETYFMKAKPALSFLLKLDNRKTIGIKNKVLIILIYVAGLLISAIAGFTGILPLLIVSIAFPFIAVSVARILYSPIRKSRETVLDKIYSLKRDRMGLKEKGVGLQSISPSNSEFEVLDWDEDFVSPTRIRLFIPTNFDPMGESAFLEQFNVYLSKGSAKWAPDRTDPDDMGWNYNAGHVTIRRMPPLPKKAIWSEKYLLNDSMAWSFFPLALGVENGVKLYNEETGKDDYVLGFDVSGDERKIKDVQVGAEVVQAPQILIAGGTGGGKSLSVDTIIPTVVT